MYVNKSAIAILKKVFNIKYKYIWFTLLGINSYLNRSEKERSPRTHKKWSERLPASKSIHGRFSKQAIYGNM